MEVSKKDTRHQIPFSKMAPTQPCSNKCKCTVMTVWASMEEKELQRARPKGQITQKIQVLKAAIRHGQTVEGISLKFSQTTYWLRKKKSRLMRMQTRKKSAARNSFHSYSSLNSLQLQPPTKYTKSDKNSAFWKIIIILNGAIACSRPVRQSPDQIRTEKYEKGP